MNWINIPLERIGWRIGGAGSKRRHNGYYICAYIKEEGPWSREITVEGGCERCTFNGVLCKNRSIPNEIEHVIVMCVICQTPIFRVSGFTTGQWKLEGVEE